MAWEEAPRLQNKKQGSFYRQNVPLSQFNSGIKALFRYDTHDFVANPSGGQALNLAYNWYDNSLGSDTHFDSVDMQYDLYHALDTTTLLAWEVVAWVGSGTMSDKRSELFDSHWLPSVGVGYRFEFKKRMNVRLDYGSGQHSSGFYFQAGEAFCCGVSLFRFVGRGAGLCWFCFLKTRAGPTTFHHPV